ncbi:MAG: hypothetical protein CL477_19055 [Acidobacteria bacterium]|jgi:hypothetical protein|nr:hypothetical protein [Acidobacteriota bacterium]|tara:strand:- start:4917 stop:5756 length:840 start_codon:yes stop_codon:yes gene_type:complete
MLVEEESEMSRCPRLLAVATLLLSAIFAGLVGAAESPALTTEQIREFLLTAEVVAAEPIGRGVTHPWRLTLSDGKVTHDAAFHSVNESSPLSPNSQRGEPTFIDSSRYNVAAYRLAEILGLDDMMPVTVAREWRGMAGAISWWIDTAWDEGTRLSEHRWPDDMRTWSDQMYRMLVFAELVHDTDRNLGNTLYTADWKLWMIDFSRSFLVWGGLRQPENITRCDRALFAELQQLTRAEVERKTRPFLTLAEIDALFERRDRLVDHIEKLIAGAGGLSPLY